MEKYRIEDSKDTISPKELQRIDHNDIDIILKKYEEQREIDQIVLRVKKNLRKRIFHKDVELSDF